MSTEVLKVDPARPDPAVIAHAAAILLGGGLVAFPTETVYGLGGLADDASSVAKIYAAKGRPSNNPLIAHVAGVDEARAISGAWLLTAEQLARAFWPGPLTLVVARGERIPRALSAGLDAMAVRAPRHPVATALLRAVGRPIAAPSANPSMQLSPTRAEHVLKGLSGRIDAVIDAGPCPVGIESTVVDVTRDPPMVLRPGSLTLEMLARVVPSIVQRRLLLGDDEARVSPGLDGRHYAPRARLLIVPRAEITVERTRALAPVGVISLDVPIGIPGTLEHPLPADPASYASALFTTLHALDDAGCKTIVAESIPDDPSWAAIRDRLERASATAND